jgi:hypothetical protein
MGTLSNIIATQGTPTLPVTSLTGDTASLNTALTGIDFKLDSVSASGKILGRNTSGSGVIEEIPISVIPQTTGFTIAGGTTSKTLTISGDTTLSGTPAVLGANTFTGTQTFGDNILTQAMLVDCGYGFLDKGNSSTTTQTLDYTAAPHQKITVTGAHTINTSNWPPSGKLGMLLLELVNGASSTITWSLATTTNWIKSDGSYSTTYSGSGVTLQSAGTDWIYIWTRDAGTTVFVKVVR